MKSCPTHNMQILLIEDEPLSRRVERCCLEDMGCTVWEATTSKQAEDLWRHMALDGIVLDHRLPDGLGLDLLRRMRRLGHNEFVIWLSADTDVLSRENARELNLHTVLSKPLDHQCLKQAVDLILQSEYRRRETA